MDSNPLTEEFLICLLSLVTLLEVVQNLKRNIKADLPCSFLAILCQVHEDFMS